MGARLRELRLKKRESLQDVGNQVGVTRAHIFDLELGRSNPSIELLATLAEYFDTSISALVGEGPKKTDDPLLIAIYRDLKIMTKGDREIIHSIVKTLKKRSNKRS